MTLQKIEQSTGVPTRTLSRYKIENQNVYELLELATIASSLNYSINDFLAIRKIESLFELKDYSEDFDRINSIFNNAFAISSKKQKTKEQKNSIRLGMFAQSMNLNKEILIAYKKILERLQENLEGGRCLWKDKF